MIRIAAFVIVTIVLVGSASCHDLVSPCPDIFKYDPKVEQELATHWYGVINLQANESLYGLMVDILLTNKADSLDARYWPVTTHDNTAFSIQDAKFNMETGERLQIRFFTQYRDTNNVPALQVIRFNGREICSDSGMPDIMPPPPRSQVACGIHGRGHVINQLIVAGGKTLPGEWPWLVALFHSTDDGQLAFQCGGSLLGNRFIITAAHCLYNPTTKKQVQTKDVVIIAGARDISRETYDGNNTRSLAAIYIHKEYDTLTNINDIALLVLNEPVTYSKFVKPVCLWEGDDDLDELVNAGQHGTVVGWGATGNGLSLEAPLRISVPIISLLICRGSHRLYHDLTTDRSLCTASAYGGNQGPCNGDSGSGLYIEQNGRWRLRGVVSTSLKSNSGSIPCNLTLPVIYTDVAKYRNWISDTAYYRPKPEAPSISNTVDTMSRIRDKYAWIEQCSERKNINPLVTNEQMTRVDDWPWHVAIYHNAHKGSSSSIRYICGGSLISDSHVLTAAHCLINKATGKPVEKRGISIYLGTKNLKFFSENIQFKLVDRLDIHREYNVRTQYKDIAVLKLSRPVDLTAAVRPVHLWPEDKVDLDNVVGKYGSVAGWRNDENGLLEDELRLAELRVATREACVASYFSYQRHTNDFTFCAGLLQDTSVCSSDTGGGMIFKLPTGSNTEEWFLRGIVSLSHSTADTCDPTRYFVFTDVAKYLDWIKVIISRDM